MSGCWTAQVHRRTARAASRVPAISRWPDSAIVAVWSSHQSRPARAAAAAAWAAVTSPGCSTTWRCTVSRSDLTHNEVRARWCSGRRPRAQGSACDAQTTSRACSSPSPPPLNNIARNNSPLPRKTMENRQSSTSPSWSRATPMSHRGPARSNHPGVEVLMLVIPSRGDRRRLRSPQAGVAHTLPLRVLLSRERGALTRPTSDPCHTGLHRTPGGRACASAAAPSSRCRPSRRPVVRPLCVRSPRWRLDVAGRRGLRGPRHAFGRRAAEASSRAWVAWPARRRRDLAPRG